MIKKMFIASFMLSASLASSKPHANQTDDLIFTHWQKSQAQFKINAEKQLNALVNTLSHLSALGYPLTDSSSLTLKQFGYDKNVVEFFKESKANSVEFGPPTLFQAKIEPLLKKLIPSGPLSSGNIDDVFDSLSCLDLWVEALKFYSNPDQTEKDFLAHWETMKQLTQNKDFPLLLSHLKDIAGNKRDAFYAFVMISNSIIAAEADLAAPQSFAKALLDNTILITGKVKSNIYRYTDYLALGELLVSTVYNQERLTIKLEKIGQNPKSFEEFMDVGGAKAFFLSPVRAITRSITDWRSWSVLKDMHGVWTFTSTLTLSYGTSAGRWLFGKILDQDTATVLAEAAVIALSWKTGVAPVAILINTGLNLYSTGLASYANGLGNILGPVKNFLSQTEKEKHPCSSAHMNPDMQKYETILCLKNSNNSVK